MIDNSITIKEDFSYEDLENENEKESIQLIMKIINRNNRGNLAFIIVEQYQLKCALSSYFNKDNIKAGVQKELNKKEIDHIKNAIADVLILIKTSSLQNKGSLVELVRAIQCIEEDLDFVCLDSKMIYALQNSYNIDIIKSFLPPKYIDYLLIGVLAISHSTHEFDEDCECNEDNIMILSRNEAIANYNRCKKEDGLYC